MGIVAVKRRIPRPYPHPEEMCIRDRLGFVFQAFHLLPEYTVRDNILLPLLLDKRCLLYTSRCV